MKAVLPSPRHLLALLGIFVGVAAAGIVIAQSAPKAAARRAPVPKGHAYRRFADDGRGHVRGRMLLVHGAPL